MTKITKPPQPRTTLYTSGGVVMSNLTIAQASREATRLDRPGHHCFAIYSPDHSQLWHLSVHAETLAMHFYVAPSNPDITPMRDEKAETRQFMMRTRLSVLALAMRAVSRHAGMCGLGKLGEAIAHEMDEWAAFVSSPA